MTFSYVRKIRKFAKPPPPSPPLFIYDSDNMLLRVSAEESGRLVSFDFVRREKFYKPLYTASNIPDVWSVEPRMKLIRKKRWKIMRYCSFHRSNVRIVRCSIERAIGFIIISISNFEFCSIERLFRRPTSRSIRRMILLYYPCVSLYSLL